MLLQLTNNPADSPQLEGLISATKLHHASPNNAYIRVSNSRLANTHAFISNPFTREEKISPTTYNCPTKQNKKRSRSAACHQVPTSDDAQLICVHLVRAICFSSYLFKETTKAGQLLTH